MCSQDCSSTSKNDQIPPVATIDRILASPIYKGEYEWGKNCTGIANEIRVVQGLRQDEWVVVEDFCEPLVPTERWNRVADLRESRKRPSESSEASSPVVPTAKGVALKHELSGLVICGTCGASMKVDVSRPYKRKDGTTAVYVHYRCPNRTGDDCENQTSVPEDWLRGIVVERILDRIFCGAVDRSTLSQLAENDSSAWAKEIKEQIRSSEGFQELLHLIGTELESLSPDDDSQRRELREAIAEVNNQLEGWNKSLSMPELPHETRVFLGESFAKATLRHQKLIAKLSEIDARAERRDAACDADEALEQLLLLGRHLGGDQASVTNVVLAQHIEGIYCDPDGTVVIRLCKLGILGKAFDLAEGDELVVADRRSLGKGRSRRRTRRRIGSSSEEGSIDNTANDFAVDVERFANLGSQWFEEFEYTIPRKLSWAEQNAKAVAHYRLDKAATMEATAAHFGKTTPTIREALKYAKRLYGIDASGRKASEKNRRSWARDNAARVAAFLSQAGVKMKDAVEHFGKSEPTVRKARKYAEEHAA